MPAFLLWNVRGKPLDTMVEALVRHHQIDIVVLVEYAFGLSQLSGALQAYGFFRRPSPNRFGVFVRAAHRLARLRYRLGGRAVLWQLTPPSGQEGLLAVVHGLDRRNYEDSTRRAFFREVTNAIRRHERKRGHTRTVIAGDFNAHPFESAVAASDGLHAIGTRAIRSSTTRRVRSVGAPSAFFYNPMWRMYGHPPHPDAGAATHYWLGDQGLELGWHMLDQVVLRPGELARFPENRLQGLTEAGGVSLLDAQGLPDARTASDHLPLVFHWAL